MTSSWPSNEDPQVVEDELNEDEPLSSSIFSFKNKIQSPIHGDTSYSSTSHYIPPPKTGRPSVAELTRRVDLDEKFTSLEKILLGRFTS